VSGEVVSAGSGNGGLINRDDGTVGVGDKTGVGSVSVGGIHTTVDTLGSEVVSAGSGDSGLISGDNSTVGVSDKAGDMEGTAVGVGGGGDDRGGDSGSGGDDRGGNSGSGSDDGSSGGISSTLGGEVVSAGSNNSGLVSGGHSSVGVGNQAGDMEGTAVAISGSIGGSGSDDGSSNSVGSSDNRGSGNNGSSGSIDSALGGKVVSTGSGNSGLIDGGDSSVGVGLESVESRGVSVSSSVSISSAVGVGRGIPSELGGKMVSLGSSNGGLIKGGHSSVGVGLKTEKAGG